jgi:hypothetical protein
MAQAANAMAHIAVTSFWLVCLALVLSYGAHFSKDTALSWLYASASSWIFTWFVLDLVKVTLSTILELSLLNQRRRLEDYKTLRDKAASKKAKKWGQMDNNWSVRGTGAILPKLADPSRLGNIVPPVPPQPLPMLAMEDDDANIAAMDPGVEPPRPPSGGGFAPIGGGVGPIESPLQSERPSSEGKQSEAGSGMSASINLISPGVQQGGQAWASSPVLPPRGPWVSAPLGDAAAG